MNLGLTWRGSIQESVLHLYESRGSNAGFDVASRLGADMFVEPEVNC
jgi:hypothetical protein